MSENHKFYEVIEYKNDGTISTYVLIKENAERLYRTIRARGDKADIKPHISKIKGL